MLNWPQDAGEWEQGTGTLWIDLQGPSPADVESLAERFGLNPFVVRACLHPEHRARIKEFGHHILLVLNGVGRGVSESGTTSELGRWRTLELNVVVGERFVLTVHPEPLAALTLLYQRVGQGEGRAQTAYLLHAISEAVTLGFYVLLDRMDRHVEEAEGLIFSGHTEPKVVDRLFALKKHILLLRRALGPQRDALGALMRRDFPLLPPESKPYFMDVYEHNLRLLDLLDTYRDLISSSLDAYLSTVSNRMNEIMKTLTIVSVITLPLSAISGIFGMNMTRIPLSDVPWGFPAVIAFMAMISLGLGYYFKRRGWF